MADAIVKKWRRRCVLQTLENDAALVALVPADDITSRYPIAAKPDLAVVVGVSPGAEGRFGWRGGVIDRYTVDVFVNASAGGDLQEKADDIEAAIDAVLGGVASSGTEGNLDAALAVLTTPQTTITASARMATPWQDVDEPGPEGQQHRSADFEVEFRSTT